MNSEKHFINSIYYQIEQTAKYCRQLGIQIFSNLNLSLSLDEFTTLDTIFINGEICQRDLAKLILKDRPSTGRILNSLEEKGFIKRFADTKNNRLVRKMKLTAKGKNILEKATKMLKSYFEKLPETLDEKRVETLKQDMSQFRQILQKEVEMRI